MPAAPPDRWAVRWRPAPAARLRLFCLPHAGGSSIAYRLWSQMLAPDIEVISIRLPGRETRFGEPVPGRIEDLAALLVRDIVPLIEPPYAWFGHSMGALAAFEACQAARDLGLAPPERLLVSGRPAPHLPLRHAPVHDAPTPDLVARLRDYSGTRQELFDDAAALGVFISVLRADLAISETYSCRSRPPLDCPISAFGGTDDQFVSERELEAWRVHTAAGFRVRLFRGGHFFLHEVHDEMLPALTADLT